MEQRNQRQEGRDILNRIVEDITKLSQEADEAKRSEKVRQYLTFCATFHNYSPFNVWWLLAQSIERGVEVERFAGLKTWNKVGRMIKKGERAYRVLAPREVRRVITETEMGEDPENGKKQEIRTEREQVRTYFYPAPVFDISQTYVIPGKEDKYVPLDKVIVTSGDASDALPLAWALAESFLPVVEVETLGGALGRTDYTVINVLAGLEPATKVEVLLHETAHVALEHRNREQGKETREVEAATTAYVLANYLGLKSHGATYLALWDQGPREIMSSMDRVLKVATLLIVSLRKLGPMCETPELPKALQEAQEPTAPAPEAAASASVTCSCGAEVFCVNDANPCRFCGAVFDGQGIPSWTPETLEEEPEDAPALAAASIKVEIREEVEKLSGEAEPLPEGEEPAESSGSERVASDIVAIKEIDEFCILLGIEEDLRKKMLVRFTNDLTALSHLLNYLWKESRDNEAGGHIMRLMDELDYSPEYQAKMAYGRLGQIESLEEDLHKTADLKRRRTAQPPNEPCGFKEKMLAGEMTTLQFVDHMLSVNEYNYCNGCEDQQCPEWQELNHEAPTYELDEDGCPKSGVDPDSQNPVEADEKEAPVEEMRTKELESNGTSFETTEGSLRLSKKAFKSLVESLVPFADKKSVMPALNCILFNAADGWLCASASDLDNFAEYSSEYVGQGRMWFMAEADSLKELAKKVGERVQISQKGDTVTIEDGRSTITLKSLNPGDFPYSPAKSTSTVARHAFSTFKDLLARVLPAASRDSARPALCGILMDYRNDGGRFASCDSFRLAVTSFDGVFPEKTMLVPWETLKKITALKLKDAVVQVKTDGYYAYFDLGATTVAVRLVEGKYPDIDGLIPDHASKPAFFLLLNAKATADAIKAIDCRCTVTFHISGRDVRLTTKDKNGLVLETQLQALDAYGSMSPESREVYSFEEYLEALEDQSSYSNGALEISYNPRFFLEGLATFDGELLMSIEDPNKPTLLRPVDESSKYLYLIMPVKV